jgi:hypothetical protein
MCDAMKALIIMKVHKVQDYRAYATMHETYGRKLSKLIKQV